MRNSLIWIARQSDAQRSGTAIAQRSHSSRWGVRLVCAVCAVLEVTAWMQAPFLARRAVPVVQAPKGRPFLSARLGCDRSWSSGAVVLERSGVELEGDHVPLGALWTDGRWRRSV